jgi:transcription elongation factor GreA
MSKAVTMSAAAFEKLIKQVVYFAENKDSLLEEYFPSLSRESREFYQFITTYIAKVEELIKRVAVKDDSQGEIPFVVIDSQVSIKDLDSQDVYQYRVVNPSINGIDSNDISFLSPVGRALLLKNKGETVTVKTPAGEVQYLIQSIHFH